MQPHQDAVPFADRDSVFPQALVRVWVKVPHLPVGPGLHPVTVPQHLVPLALRLSLLQFFRVRVWVKLLPAQTVFGCGDQEVGAQLGQRLLPDTVLVEAGLVPPTQVAVIFVTLRLWLTRRSLQVVAGLGDQLPTLQRQVGGQYFVPVVDLDDAGSAPPSQ